MASREEVVRVARFGRFEADLGTGELRRKGRPVALEEQPFAVLTACSASACAFHATSSDAAA